MNYKQELLLSPELEKYRHRIEATVKPYIEIDIENNEWVDWWQSKFGGLPYLPKGFEYPKAANGKYLFLLAQINYAEVPPLEGFPTQGILQFFIGDDGLYGVDRFETPGFDSETYKVIYFPQVDFNINNIVTDYGFLPQPESFPLVGCYSLQFTKKYAPITVDDYQFKKELGEEFYNFFKSDEKIEEEYFALSSSGGGHKIGGYPTFMQSDSRDMSYHYPDWVPEDPDILLFQIDTETNDSTHIMWGDSGIANFFIPESGLRNLDFSEVFYTWDCL
jgi:uncharacterized protein YwqG